MDTYIICDSVKNLYVLDINNNSNFMIEVKDIYGTSKVGVDVLYDIREIVNCMKWFNRIYPVRSNINVNISNNGIQPTYMYDVGDINHQLKNTGKTRQKRYILDNIKLFNDIDLLSMKFFVTYQENIMNFDVLFETICSCVEIDFGDLLKFLSFLCVYAFQATWTFRSNRVLKNVNGNVSEIRFDLKCNITQKNENNISFSNVSTKDGWNLLYIDEVYRKFFLGCGCSS